MPQAGRHVDQIARVDLNAEDGALVRVDVKDAAPFDDEANFILPRDPAGHVPSPAVANANNAGRRGTTLL